MNATPIGNPIEEDLWQVTIRYDDPRAGIWRGPIEEFALAKRRALNEAQRVHGQVWLEKAP